MCVFFNFKSKTPCTAKMAKIIKYTFKKKRTSLFGLEQKTFLFGLTPYIYMPVQPDFRDLKKLWYSIAPIVCYTVCYVMLQILKEIQAEVSFSILSINDLKMNVDKFCKKRNK